MAVSFPTIQLPLLSSNNPKPLVHPFHLVHPRQRCDCALLNSFLKKKTTEQSLRPMTVQQTLDAKEVIPDHPCVLDGRPVNNVRVLMNHLPHLISGRAHWTFEQCARTINACAIHNR